MSSDINANAAPASAAAPKSTVNVTPNAAQPAATANARPQHQGKKQKPGQKATFTPPVKL